MPDFEFRKEQTEMAEKVHSALWNSENLIIEAGTGVGKSLAYLIPAAIYSLENEKTVVISTETKALQNQLLKKDIPVVAKVLGTELKAEIALGANNYVCKRKLSQVITNGTFGPEMTDYLKEFYAWEKETETGIKSEYRGFASSDFWNRITRESDNCLGKDCPNFPVSYYFLEKEKWKKSNILIVNHHLLARHIAGDFKILPDFTNIIVDEAHNFPDILGKAFGKETSYEEILNLLNYIYTPEKKTGVFQKVRSEALQSEISKLSSTAHLKLVGFFNKLITQSPIGFSGSQRITKNLSLDEGALEDTLYDIADKLSISSKEYNRESENSSEKETSLELEMSAGRLKDTAEILESFRKNNDPELVVWLDSPDQRKEERFQTIHIQPLNPDKIVTDSFLPRLENITFTSATLSSGKKDFKFFRKNIGDIPADEVILNSPFHYEKNSLLYLPRSMRDPASQGDEFHADLIQLIPHLLDLTSGNTFVLFTSFKSLNTVYEAINEDSKYPLFSQSILGPENAKIEFLNTPNSVLFGVSTFWQGIDVKGDRLKSVIIAKLPFQPPGEPVLEAKIEEMKRANGNPFADVQLPHCILTLKQGFGRLIRSQTDTGIVSILDPRIQTKSYGRTILESLPAAKRVFSFKELRQEYEKLPKYI
ncbi:MAG: ATP-dependent DNA helicase [Leptospira sp.]|nr:ATP-dependent DNA helicase [Leptospira sp.]